MSANSVNHEISYFEIRAINELAHAHLDELGNSLRAIVAFGNLVTAGNTFDIELMEVVEDWQGVRTVEYDGSFSQPLRGRFRVYFLSAAEFEDWRNIQNVEDRKWVRELLQRVLYGYEVMLESPAGYARDVLARGMSLLEERDPIRISQTLAPPRAHR